MSNVSSWVCSVLTWRAVARAQHDRHQVLLGFVIEGQGGDQRQVTPRVIVAMEEGERLLPMHRIIGGIQINGAAFFLSCLQACSGHPNGWIPTFVGMTKDHTHEGKIRL